MLDLLLPAFVAPLLLGFLLDRALGDPTTFGHPIIFFGRLIGWGEKHLNHGKRRLLKGFIYNGSLVLLTFFLPLLISLILLYKVGESSWQGAGSEGTLLLLGYGLVSTLLIFYMLSGKTLRDEVQRVFRAVGRSLEEGRTQVGRIVGRDTGALSTQEIRTAALETLAENLSDGVVGPMLSWAFLGTSGILTYKMINTQDSMVGYLNERYRDYGYFSAKLDDLANLLPSRLTAVLMLLSAGRLDLLSKTFRHGRRHLSPNSGYPEAALALMLGCRFGGPHDYFGEVVDKPFIGEEDRPLTDEDLQRALTITRRTELLALVVSLVVRALILLGLSLLFLVLLFSLG